MKKRIIKFLNHLTWKYTASTSQIVDLEAKRYCKYLTENYSEYEQNKILNNLHIELLDYRENQIKNQEIKIIEDNEKLNLLKSNLEKLK